MATKLVTAVASIVICVILVATVMIPTVQDGKDLFNKDVDYTFNNVGDQIAEGSLTEEYTVDWDSALPGMIKVNGDTPTVYFVAGEDATVSPTQKDVVTDLTYGELPTPTRTGYTFDGWYTSTEYTTEVTDTTVVIGTEDKILYAKWVGNTYTVTFDADGGTVSPATKTVTYGQTYGELPTPTHTGHIFGGWFDENNNPIVAQSEVSIADDHTLTAVWTLEQYLVSFTTDGNGTVDTAEVLVDYGTSYTILNNTITIDGTTITATPASGYVWDYWEPSTDGVVTGAMTFIAHFNNPPVTLSFVTDGAVGATVSQASIADVPMGSTYVVADNEVTVSYGGTTIGTVTASITPNYVFVGWDVPQGVGTVSDAMTFEAQYEVIGIRQVATSGMTSWIVTDDYRLFGVGSVGKGQQGNGDTSTTVTSFTQRLENESIASVACSRGSTWAITTDGKIYGTGMIGSSTITTFTDYTPSGETVSKVSTLSYSNSENMCAILTSSGKIYTISQFQNSPMPLPNSTTFTDRTPSGKTVVDFAISYNSIWIVDNEHHVLGRGTNGSGQQGSGDTTNVSTFTDRTPSGETVEKVYCSGYYGSFDGVTWILTQSGKAFGTGLNDYSQQGDGLTTNITSFTDRTPSGETITDISCSYVSTMLLTASGKVYAAGVVNSLSSPIQTFTDHTPSGETIVKIQSADYTYRSYVGFLLSDDGKLYKVGIKNGTSIGNFSRVTETGKDSRYTMAACGIGDDDQWAILEVSTNGVSYGISTLSRPIGGTDYNQSRPVMIALPGSMDIQQSSQLSPQINPLSPINLNPLHPFTPIPIQPMSIDYTAITGFSTWQLGGEDWMLATVTTGEEQYALALYYAGLTEPLVWDEDVHMVFDNGTLTVENGGNTYNMTYSSIYYRDANGQYVLNTTGGYLKGDSQFLAYMTPTEDSGALVKGTLSDNTTVGIADGSITLGDAVITSSESGEYPGLFNMSSVSVQYDTDQTASASAIIMPKSVTVTVQQPDDMYGVLLDAVIIFVMVAILLAIVGMFVYTRS